MTEPASRRGRRPPGRYTRTLPACLAILALALLAAGCGGRATHKKKKDPFPGMNAQQVYDLGMKQFNRKKYTKSRDTLQAALSRDGATPALIANVHLALADSFFRDGGLLNLAEAQSRYTNGLTFEPNHERADYAQYQLGLCYLRQAANPGRDQAQTQKALSELLKVESSYPNSEYVVAAMHKADEARELLAEHEYRIGHFYFKRKDYKGAVTRLKEILEKYPAYSRKPDVYLTLGRSLIALERKDEGDLYLQKLVSELPESRQAAKAQLYLEVDVPEEPEPS